MLTQELPQFPEIDQIHESQLKWWARGWDARQPEVDRLNGDADRFYALLYSPRPPITIGPSHVELERVRAEIYGGAK